MENLDNYLVLVERTFLSASELLSDLLWRLGCVNFLFAHGLYLDSQLKVGTP